MAFILHPSPVLFGDESGSAHRQWYELPCVHRRSHSCALCISVSMCIRRCFLTSIRLSASLIQGPVQSSLAYEAARSADRPKIVLNLNFQLQDLSLILHTVYDWPDHSHCWCWDADSEKHWSTCAWLLLSGRLFMSQVTCLFLFWRGNWQ